MRILFLASLALALGVSARAERYEADGTGIPKPREEKAAEPVPPPPIAIVDELEILAKKRGWAEVVMRLPEVPLNQRDARYEKLLELSAENYLSELATEGGSGLDQIADRLLVEFPPLRKSSSFLARRNGFGLAAVESCYELTKDSTECDLRLKALVEADAGNPGLVLQASRLARARSGSGTAVMILSLASGQASQVFLCQDPDVKSAVIEALELPEGEASRRAGQLATGGCFEAIRASLTQELARSPASKTHFRKHACEALGRRGVVPLKCQPAK